MAIEKYIIDKSDLTALLRGEDLAIQPKGNIRGFCVEIAGNLTNGDVIKAMFPSMEIDAGTQTKDWWNTPYNAETNEDMTSSHSEKDIYNSFIRMMKDLKDKFYEYLVFLGVDIENLDEDEQFRYSLSTFEIVNELFLLHTNHSGGTSTRMKIKELGLTTFDSLVLDFSENIEG